MNGEIFDSNLPLLYAGGMVVNNISQSGVIMDWFAYRRKASTPLLPKGYTAVDYIQDDGNKPYIKIPFDSEYIAELDLQYQHYSARQLMGTTGSVGAYFGVETSNIYSLGGGYDLINSNALKRQVITYKRLTSTTILISENNSINRGNATKVWDFYFCGLPMYNNGFFESHGLKIYGAKFYQNDKLVYQLKPCKNPQGEYGLFDLINKKFYGNNNNVGSFIGGNDASSTVEQPTFVSYNMPKFNNKYVDTTVKYSKTKTVTEKFEFTPSAIDWSLVFTPIRYPVTFSTDYTSSYKNLMTVEQGKITINRIPSENIVEEIEIDTVGASFELLHRTGEGLYLYVWRDGLLEKEYTLSNVDMQLTYAGYKIENVNSTFEFTSENFKKNYASLNYDYSTTMVLPDFD